MKSLLYTAALLPLGALGWSWNSAEVDEVVVVTSTRTVTVCPITDYWTCAPHDSTSTSTWEDWTSKPTGASTTKKSVSPTSVHSSGGGHGGHGGGGPSSGSSSKLVSPVTTSGYAGGHGGHGGSGSSSSSHPAGVATTSSYTESGNGGHGGHGGSSSISTSHPAGAATTSSYTEGGNGGHGGHGSSSSASTSLVVSPATTSSYAEGGHGGHSSSSSISTSHVVGPASGSSSSSSYSEGGNGGHGGYGSSSSTDRPVSPATTSYGTIRSTTTGKHVSPVSTSYGDDENLSSSSSAPAEGSSTSSAPSTPTTPSYTTSESTSSSYSDEHPGGPYTTTTSDSVGPDTTSSTTYENGPYTTSSTSSSISPDTTSSSSFSQTTTTTSTLSESTSTTTSSSSISTSSISTTSVSTTSTTSLSTSTSSTMSVTITSVSSSLSSTTSRLSTTSTTSCLPSQTLSALPEPSSCDDNTADDRSFWCGKYIGDEVDGYYESGETKQFTLTITSAQSNFDGTLRPAFLINGGTPGPAIEVNYGDWVEVVVTNLLTDNATAIHWHGIRQIGTNDQDGVPGVTECAIPPLGQRTYRWLASQYGTGWYHSHALSQYGGGIRGPVIIHGPSTANYDYDMGTVMVDEIFSQTIFQMAWNIARLRGPLPAAINYMLNGKNKAVDGSKGQSATWTVAPGKKHLFRIINSSAQASYLIHFDNHVMQVISADYTPIVPYTTSTLYINPGQRYNVIVTMNQTPGAYFLRAITQTGCGETNLNNGLGSLANGVFTYQGSCGTPVSDSSVAAIGATLQTDCKDEPLASLVPYVPKDGGSSAEFTDSALLLPGGSALQQNFAGYGPITRWMFGPPTDLANESATIVGTNAITVDYDNPTLKNIATLPSVSFNSSIYSNAVVLDGPAGDWVYFVIQNNFQTSHPIHLHGHDFSVLGQGKGVFSAANAAALNFANPIRRDTALLFGIPGAGGAPQGGWTVIGFQTDNPGAWVMHCHIIWHADGGMALQYIEQPDSIDAAKYYSSDSFQGECAAYDTYVKSGGEGHLSYESGLKRDLQRHQYGEKRFGRHGRSHH